MDRPDGDDAAQRNRPNEDGPDTAGTTAGAQPDPRETPETAETSEVPGVPADSEAPDPPEAAETPEVPEAPLPDLDLQPNPSSLYRRVLSTYLRRLWALLVVSALPAVPVVLLGQVLGVASARDGVFLNGVLESATDPLSTAVLVTTGVLLLLGTAVVPVGVGGAVLLGSADLLGRRLSPRQAWQGALNRYFTVLTWFFLMIALIAAAVGLLLSTMLSDWPTILTAILVLGTALFLCVPLMVSLPLALLEGHGPFRAVWEACRMARHRFGTHLLMVGSSVALTALAGTGLEQGLVAWTDLREGLPLLSVITVTVGILVAPLSLLLSCAPVAYSWRLTDSTPVSQGYTGTPDTRDLDLVLVSDRLPQSPPRRAGRASDSAFDGPPGLVVPALALAVFGLPLLGPGLVAANPFGLPRMEAHPVTSVGSRGNHDEGTVRIAPGLIGNAAYQVYAEVCDPECEPYELDHARYGSGIHVGDDGVLWTAWREYEHEEIDKDENERYDPHPDSGLYLMSCADAADCETPDTEVQVRWFSGRQFDLSSSITPLADGRLLVASHARHDDQQDAEVTGDRGGAYLHLCEDTSCAAPETVELPSDLAAGGFLTGGEYLATAASPAGGYAVALSDPARGSLALAVCADTACSEPEVTEVRGDSFLREHEGRLRPRFGVRVEYRSDGTPVLAYREPQGGRAHLVDCHDPLCAGFTDTPVSGTGWARPVPGLAVDSQDRVHLLTPDFDEGRLTLLTCLDRSCEESLATPLMELGENEPFMTVLALDEQDRPLMVRGDGNSTTSFSGMVGFEGDAVRLRCERPHCGAAPPA
ncbi:hypothetical protein [Nocardiopsis ganjiahuensis]|uniref:hypothetical protein n=1 Tax=Nocardiopsis ganjiahuensis TaxID=239984 RepID=UPI000345D578|nr:hypothetical protein [Nocardiopsis ganjiahuensis]